jgi:FKBP-type peptidyl-prolyl cis-trans isomerase 2
MKVAKGHKVRISFELRVKGGDVIESSEKSGPVEYVHGDGKILSGLEKRVEGMGVGEEKKGEIPAAEAFGTEDKLPTKEIPRKEFPAGEKLEVGRVFAAKGPQGEPISFKIVKEDKDKVTVRFLHALVGKDVTFKVKVLMIDDPKSKKRAVAMPPPPADALELSAEELKEVK